MDSVSSPVSREMNSCLDIQAPGEKDHPVTISEQTSDTIITIPSTTESRTDLDFKPLKRKLPRRVFLVPSSLLMLAIGLAGAHHFYNSFLNDQVVGSPSRQQWSIRIGTGLAWTVVASLKGVAGFAYVQLLFWLLRKKAISMGDIDALFDLRKADPSAFLAKNVWRKAIALVPFAGIIITLPIAAVFPPATLSTISALGPQQHLSSLNWTLQPTNCTEQGPDCAFGNLIALQQEVLMEGKVLDFFRPAFNTSYRLTFEGPSLSCAAPNSSQLLALNYYAKMSALKENTYTVSTLDTANSTSIYVRYFSAFILEQAGMPQLPELGDLYRHNFGYGDNEIKSLNTAQLWIQGFDENLICTLIAADFDITIAFDTDYQFVTYNNFTQKDAIPSRDVAWTNNWARVSFDEWAQSLAGNVTLFLTSDGTSDDLYAGSTFARTALNNCLVPSLKSIRSHLHNQTIPEWMWAGLHSENPITGSQSCPTGTLSGGLVQMMNNLTISMIHSDNSAIKNLTIIATLGNQIVYTYNTCELVAAYAIAILVVAMVFVAGLFAISRNGIVHDSSFSAMVAMTRNPKLDTMFASENISGYPLTDSLRKQNLQFGALRSTCKCNGTAMSHEKHCRMTIAFGTKDEIEPLQPKNKEG